MSVVLPSAGGGSRPRRSRRERSSRPISVEMCFSSGERRVGGCSGRSGRRWRSDWGLDSGSGVST